jgi:hypothetical protein
VGEERQPQAGAKEHAEPETGAALRARLLRRIDGAPMLLADIAARLGTTGADSCLCALGREVADVIRAVGESAEAERQRLEELRTTLHIAIDSRINELVVNITAAESAKIAALECELERLDAALERTRREYAAAREALTVKSDDEIEALSTALTVSLDGIDALLSTLPLGPVEPPLLRLELDEGALLSSLRTAGTVLAPRGVHAADVMVRGVPTHVRPGRPLQFELALCDDYPCRAPAELEAAAASLAFHARVEALLETGNVSQLLQATLLPSSGFAGVVTAAIVIPDGVGRGSDVVINCLSVVKQPIVRGLTLPARLRVVCGMRAPLMLNGAATNKFWRSVPAITSEGTLYAPVYGKSDLLSFSSDGSPLPPLDLAAFGLSARTRLAAFVEATRTLLLADANGVTSKLVAVDVANKSVRWTTALESNCYGIVALPTQGVVVVGGCIEHMMHVHRLSDGIRIASTKAEGAFFSTADPCTATLYVSTVTALNFTVSVFRWNGSALLSDGVFAVAGNDIRPLAVMPPAPGRHASYLIVGTLEKSSLLVFSLPDRRLVHAHELDGFEVVGLAADPSGTSLAVCDRASKAICVIPWPLPGMPSLQ